MHQPPQAFQVTISDETISIHGDVDLAVTDQLVDAILGVAERPDHQTVVVDLTGMTFLDSSGIQGLIVAHQGVAAAGKDMVIRNVPERALRALTIAGVVDYLKVAEPSGSEPPRDPAIRAAVA